MHWLLKKITKALILKEFFTTKRKCEQTIVSNSEEQWLKIPTFTIQNEESLERNEAYISSKAMAGGNHLFSFSSLAIPCTAVTGTAKKIVRSDAKTMTPILLSSEIFNGIARFLHETSLGSGAISVIHRSGCECCWDWETDAAPYLDLNVTKATCSSYKRWNECSFLITYISNPK